MNIDAIDFRRQVVVYQAPKSGLVKLQKLNAHKWGFVYLKRPDLPPVFVRDTPKKAIRATEKDKRTNRRRQCFVGTQDDLANAILNGHKLPNA